MDRPFEGGVLRYATGRAEIVVHFPVGYVKCVYCPYCIKDGRNYMRMVCFVTGEIIPAPEAGRAESCPLILEKEE